MLIALPLGKSFHPVRSLTTVHFRRWRLAHARARVCVARAVSHLLPPSAPHPVPPRLRKTRGTIPRVYTPLLIKDQVFNSKLFPGESRDCNCAEPAVSRVFTMWNPYPLFTTCLYINLSLHFPRESEKQRGGFGVSDFIFYFEKNVKTHAHKNFYNINHNICI